MGNDLRIAEVLAAERAVSWASRTVNNMEGHLEHGEVIHAPLAFFKTLGTDNLMVLHAVVRKGFGTEAALVGAARAPDIVVIDCCSVDLHMTITASYGAVSALSFVCNIIFGWELATAQKAIKYALNTAGQVLL